MIRLRLALLSLLVLGGTAAHASPQEYAACGIRFTYPAGWQVLENEKEEADPDASEGSHAHKAQCVFNLQPVDLARRMEDNHGEDNISIRLEGWDRTFEDTVPESLFEKKYDGSWVALGRQGAEGEAHTISTDEYEGLEGTTEAGCSNDEGYAGLCEIWRALVSNRANRTVYIETYNEAALHQLLESLRFEPEED